MSNARLQRPVSRLNPLSLSRFLHILFTLILSSRFLPVPSSFRTRNHTFDLVHYIKSNTSVKVRATVTGYMHTYPRLCHFVLKLMSWSFVDRLVTAGVALRDLSTAFTCPIHCGQSIFFPFLSGFSLGLLLGFLSALLLGFYLLRPSLPGAVAFPDLGLRRSVHPRLRAYCE